MDEPSILQRVAHAAIETGWLAPAAAGGLVGLLRKARRRAGECPVAVCARAVMLMSQSVLAGYLAHTAGLELDLSPSAAGAAAGAAGYLGGTFLELLEDLIRRWMRQRVD